MLKLRKRKKYFYYETPRKIGDSYILDKVRTIINKTNIIDALKKEK